MAQVKFYRGNASGYVQNTHKEGIYFSMDEKVLYHNGVKFGGIDPQYFSGVTKDFDIEGHIVSFKKLNNQGDWDNVTITLVEAGDSSVEIGSITKNGVTDGVTVKVKTKDVGNNDGLKLHQTEGLYVDLTKTTDAIAANTAKIATNKAAIDTLNGDADQTGSVAKSIKDAIGKINAGVFSGKGQVITAISQSNGIVSATATTLSADNVAFTASNTAFKSSNVKDALDTLYTRSGDGSKVTLESVDGTEGSNVLKVYTIKQGGTKVGEINIPKDLVVKSGSVVKGTWDGNTFTEEESGSGTALKLIIANQPTPVYINTLDLVKDHTAGNGIAISKTNKISVVRDPASDDFLTVDKNGVKLSGVQAAINKAAAAAKTKVAKNSSADKITLEFATADDGSVTYTIGQNDIASAALLGTTSDTKDKHTAFGYIDKEVADRKDAIKGLKLDSVGGTGKVITTISQADGKVSATAATLGAENVSASTITDDGTKVAVTGDNVKAQIASLAKSIKTVSTAAAAAHTKVEAKTDGHVRVSVAKSSDNTHDVVTITENDIASANALTTEASSRQSQDDRIEASIGLAADGSHVTTSGHYTNGATTVVGEIAALDAQLHNVSTALEWINCGDYSTSQD